MTMANEPKVTPGKNGLPRLLIDTPTAKAEIYLHGAQLTSWQPAGGEEVIFLSEQSQWQEGKAIRGGIPICFPWFRAKVDDPKAPSHGFVRTKAWELDLVESHNEFTVVSLSTTSDESTRAWWPHDFHLLHHVTIGAELTQELVVTNTGKKPLRFEEALHTYYRVSAADSIRIRGLDGVTYLDNTANNLEKKQEGDVVFTAQTDNAYMDTTQAVEIVDPGLRRRIRLTKQASRTTVVWNPWSTGAQSLSDLGDDEWRMMACAEASNIRSYAVELAPGQGHCMKTVIRVESLG
jgi:glucose-6-phosphate 1-epimerase